MRDNKLIQFYLTNICNSRCKTCNIWKNKKLEELDVKEVIEIIKENKNADFVFGGGEVTLYSQLHELLTYCDDNNINYTILSNAVNEKKLMNILDNYNIKNLTISCDGVNHDEVRGINGNLDNIKRIISLYKNKIKNIKLSYTFSKYNEMNFKKSMKMFRELGFEKIYFCLAQNMDLLFSNNSVIANNNEIILDELDMLYEKDKNFIVSMLSGNKKKCDSTDSVFTIYSNGNVVRCQSYLSNNILGNIYDTNFSDIKKEKIYNCEYDGKCNLVCQRRYD